jgi:hypothetical protein
MDVDAKRAIDSGTRGLSCGPRLHRRFTRLAKRERRPVSGMTRVRPHAAVPPIVNRTAARMAVAINRWLLRFT